MTFFKTLWPDGLQGCNLLVWVNQGEKRKRSIWCSTFEEVDAAVAQWGEYDTYFGLGLAEAGVVERHARNKGLTPADVRVEAKDVAWLPGFWADVDFDGQTDHKKHGLPSKQRVEDALLGEGSEYPPTLIVNSGGGLHLYWLFDEPLRVEDSAHISALSWGWQEYIRQQLGASMDSTHDLARVLRVPGTWNNKTTPSAQASLVLGDGPRWDFDDLAAVSARYPYQERVAADIGPLRIDANASPPMDRLNALLANDDEFKAVWDMRRTFKSASEYDISIATRLINADWIDQDVVDALIAWRRIHNIQPKLRLDYYQSTLAKPRGERVLREQLQDGPSAREDVLAAFSQIWEVNVSALKQYGSDGGFGLVIGGTEVHIPDIDGILSQRGLQRAIALAAKVMVPMQEKTRWPKMATRLLQAAEMADIGEEASSRTRIEERIESYLEDYPPERLEGDSLPIGKSPFIKDGLLCINSVAFIDHMRVTRGEQWKAKELAVHLKQAGWENTVIRAGKPLRVWTRPLPSFTGG